MKLTVQISFDRKLDFKTSKAQVIVGRAPQSDMVIPHDSVSRTHCQIEYLDGFFYLTDLGSSNGTFVDAKRIQKHDRIKFLPSQAVRIGRVECSLSKYDPADSSEIKIGQDQSVKRDQTATTRFPRLDLTETVTATEAANRVKPKGPRNPITDELQNQQVEVVESKRTYILLFILVALVLAWLMTPVFTS